MFHSRSAVSLRAVLVLFLICVTSSLGALANRVFVSARSGNDANTCDNIVAPCQTFAGAVMKLNPGGEAIVLDSGGYGPVTITQAVTIEAPPGVVAFIHPSAGDAVTINAGLSDKVVLRGLVLNGGPASGVTANTVGTLSVEGCAISGFAVFGVHMTAAGQLVVKNTDVKSCGVGVGIHNTSGTVKAAIDHCHLDGNTEGFRAATTSPGGSTTVATNSTANNNAFGWICGDSATGLDLLNLEFCSGSENSANGALGNSNNAASTLRVSNSIFSNNHDFGVSEGNVCVVLTRGNNTVTGNGLGNLFGTIGTFSPM